MKELLGSSTCLSQFLGVAYIFVGQLHLVPLGSKKNSHIVSESTQPILVNSLFCRVVCSGRHIGRGVGNSCMVDSIFRAMFICLS